MKTLVSFSLNESLPYLIAYQKGVYVFSYIGSLTYSDSLANIWNWEGVSTSKNQILGVRSNSEQLEPVDNLTDCENNDKTFFYDNGDLYVHWEGGQGDWSIDRGLSVAQVSSIVVSDSFNLQNDNKYNIFYIPELESVSGLKIQADPIKLGLLGSNQVSITINNGSGQFDSIDDTISYGSVVTVQSVDDDSNIIQNFVGYTKELQFDNKKIIIRAVEQRFFQDSTICKNTMEVAEFASLADEFKGAKKPVALGDIRRGIAIPTNSSGVDRADTQAITFLLSDPALGPLRAITKLYDNNGSELTGVSVNLTNCTATWTKPANIDVDLKKFKWEGQGHDLGFGTYNNGIDIMRYAFITFANTANVSTAFDTQTWIDSQLANTQAVGLSIADDKGIIAGIIEPITVSLQVLIISKGDGKLYCLKRDLDAPAELNLKSELFQSNISTTYSSSYFSSFIQIEYAPDFTNSDNKKTITDTTYQSDIVLNYGNVEKNSMNPIKTVLVNQADAEALSLEIYETSKRPDKIVSVDYAGLYDLTPFDIIDLPIGRDANNELPEERRLLEVLSVEFVPDRNITKIQGRVVRDYIYLMEQNSILYLTTEGGDFLIGSETVEA